MTTTIYGIKTCDTVRRARSWLDSRGISYVFHDFRVEGLDRTLIEEWRGRVGWEILLNRSSATFRALPEARKASLDDEQALELMLEFPTLVKRPILATGEVIAVGFKPDRYAELMAG